MPSIDWKWLLVGAAVGYFVVPMVVSKVRS